MSSERQAVTVRDLVDEAKKRVVSLVICVVGLSYLMSLTSSSVIVNLPVATFLLITLRYLSLDLDMRRKATTYKSKPLSANNSTWRKPFEDLTVTGRDNWKHKVNSPVVEDAIGQFTGHIVSEWVTDLWYCRITPDRQGPEELLLIINGVFGEISSRMRNINLIDLLTRDVMKLFCSRLELFRSCKNKIEKQQSRILTIAERDIELKVVLAAEKKLHPALFSAEAEHKVLQHVMDGLILFTFKPEDLRCSLFRYIVRELLACAVMRPVLNLANPRFINERIESLIISSSKSDKGNKESSAASGSKIDGSSKIPNHISGFPDPSVKGVELVPLKKDQNKNDPDYPSSNNVSGMLLSKDPLLSMDAQSTLSRNSVPEIQNNEGKGILPHRSGEEWGDMLDVFSQRKNEALNPEHLDNLWTKGRGYKKEEINHPAAQVRRNSLVGVSNSAEQPQGLSQQKKTERDTMGSFLEKNVSNSGYSKCPRPSTTSPYEEENEHGSVPSDGIESWSSSYTDDEDTNNITGLDSPAIKVWDGKNKGNLSHIHHPLETFEGHKNGKANKACLHSTKLHGTKSAKKRFRSSVQGEIGWQEAERTSSLLRELQGKENLSFVSVIPGEDISEDSEAEQTDRIYSGATTSPSMSLASLPESHILAAKSAKNSIIANSFFRLRCEVIGANIVKSGSKTFAVYSISVTDVNNNNWSIKRRFRHFEEFHRRLKDFPEYNLHLPPKYFLSTGLDVLIIQERCKLLDQYLKLVIMLDIYHAIGDSEVDKLIEGGKLLHERNEKLLQLPTVSCSIEVWDFLSVDSQMYIFSNSLSILETISVDRNATVSEKRKENGDTAGPLHEVFPSEKEKFSNGSHVKINVQALSSSKKPEPSNNSENVDQNKICGARNLGRITNRDQQASHSFETSVLALSSEWIPPNLSVPIMDLVDVVLQLNDGGWIRRKAFWAAKQVLQLGMGDAFDDWLIKKIQLLRQGSVVASGIRRLEQILWPDEIFITKHPAQQNPSSASPSHDSHGHQPSSTHSSHNIDDIQNLKEMQEKRAEQRAKLVYEIMIDKAPAAIVGLVGRKKYDLCAMDLYYFIQSPVCMKQLAFDLLQLLLSSAFPELGDVFRQLEEEKDKFGKLELN